MLEQMDVEFWDRREGNNASRLTLTVYDASGQYLNYLSKYLSVAETNAIFPKVNNFGSFTEWNTVAGILLDPKLPESVRLWTIKAVAKLTKGKETN